MKKRVGWIDVTKGIAILLVILGHSLIGLKVNDLIFAFHMPLFFVLSGYLFRQKEIKTTIINNAKKLLIPYCVTGIIVTLARGISAYIQHWDMASIKNVMFGTLKSMAFGFGVDESRWFFPVWSIGAIWFLLAFFWNTIFMQILFKWTAKYGEAMRAICVLGFAGIWYVIGQYLWIPTNMDVGGFAVIFTYFGYLLAKYEVLEQCKSVWFWIMAAVLLWYCYQTGGVNMVIRVYPNALSIVGALAGVMMVMQTGQQIAKYHPLERVLSWYGRNSMKILCVHLFEMMIIPWDLLATQVLKISSGRVFVFGCRVLWATAVCFLLELCGKLWRKRCFLRQK